MDFESRLNSIRSAKRPRQRLRTSTTKVLSRLYRLVIFPLPSMSRARQVATMSLTARRATSLLAPTRRYQSTAAATAQLSPRWLSDLKSRIGACISFGLTPAQTAVAGSILHEVARDWRELVAGSEGYLTSPSRRGLHRWPVAWGEQDSMVRFAPLCCCPLRRTGKSHVDRKLRYRSGDF